MVSYSARPLAFSLLSIHELTSLTAVRVTPPPESLEKNLGACRFLLLIWVLCRTSRYRSKKGLTNGLETTDFWIKHSTKRLSYDWV